MKKKSNRAKGVNNTRQTASEIKVGKHGIGYVYQVGRLPKTFAFKKSSQIGAFQKLPRVMSDDEIERELKPGMCTLANVITFLDNASEDCKDGYANLFYLKECVVFVRWNSYDRYWCVRAWDRGGRDWGRGFRVFSPAIDQGTQTSATKNLTLEPSDTLPLELVINGHTYRRCDRDGAPLP